MKAVMLYRSNSEHERTAFDYARDIQMQTGKRLELLDVDSPQGVNVARLYDIVSYPTLLVTDNSGNLQSMWSGDQLPTISEAGYYITDEKSFIQ